MKSAELSQSGFLQREQHILSSLSSPHVVSYKGCDITMEDNDMLVYNLFMEYVPGGTVTDTIRKRGGRLEESVIGYYSRQIVQGLEYLHSHGLVHCDIKGRNILISEDGAKIADFGCAKWVDKVEEAAPIGGTPIFMAPEVARGEEQGFPCDIWALGCTIIEMATGGAPWPDVADPVTALYHIAYSGELPEFPSCLPDQEKDFLDKCLRRSPKERWTASQLLKHPFLVEFNSSAAKAIQESNSSSPTSILDQGFWNTLEVSESQSNLVCTRVENPTDDRIRRLSSLSGVPSWTWSENWFTIRGKSCEESNIIMDDFESEADIICGSAIDSIVNGVEELDGSTVGGEGWLNFSSNNVNSSCESLLGLCKCRKSSIGLINFSFERDKDKLFLPSSTSFLSS